MFKDKEGRKTRGSRSAFFAYAVDDLRVIANNGEGKREDRFLNLIRGWREKLLSREHMGDAILWRRSNEDGRSDREMRARQGETERVIVKERKKREKEGEGPSLWERAETRSFVCAISLHRTSFRTGTPKRYGPRGILQGPASASYKFELVLVVVPPD